VKGLFPSGIEKSFAPLEIRVATTGISAGFKALLAPLETFSNGVNEPSHWKVKDLLTGFTLPSNIFETMNRQTSEEVNEDGFYSKWKTDIGR